MTSKAEYLKRYLSGGDDANRDTKTARKKAKRKKGDVKIIDESSDWEADQRRLQRLKRKADCGGCIVVDCDSVYAFRIG